MKPDDFEQRLRRQTLRQVPTGWREEILAAAIGRASSVERRAQERSESPTLVARLSSLLWPHPAAWAGLAAVWMLILAMHFSVREPAPAVAEKSAPPSPAVMVELRQQRRLLAELIGPRDASAADRSKSFVPQPRTEREEFMAA